MILLQELAQKLSRTQKRLDDAMVKLNDARAATSGPDMEVTMTKGRYPLVGHLPLHLAIAN